MNKLRAYIFSSAAISFGLFIAWQYFAPRNSRNDSRNVIHGIRDDGVEASAKTEASNSMPVKYAISPKAVSFDQLRIEAENGSPAAQRKVAELYGFSMPYSLNPLKWLAGLDDMVAVAPAIKGSMEGVKHRMSARCDQIDHGEPIPSEGVKNWQKTAAQNGDIAASIRERMSSIEPLTSTEAQQFVDVVIASRDPDAMLELSQLLLRPIEGELAPGYSELAGGAIHGSAWSVAACRLGAECASGSLLMDSLCVNTGECNFATYEDYIQNEVVPSGRMPEFSRNVGEIMNLVKKDGN